MPAYLIARELKDKLRVIFVSQMADPEVIRLLESCGVDILNLRKRFFFSGSLRTFEAWLRRTERDPTSSPSLIINFSQCFLTPAHVYYAQGPVTRALDDMCAEMNQTYRLIYRLARRYFVRRDKIFVKRLGQISKLLVANSVFCASMYEAWGCEVDEVIYPPLDCDLFKPTTTKPSQDYVLAYAGKETRFSILKELAETGLKVKMFGSKAPFPQHLLKQPNLEFLGKITDEELVSLYSNALFTLSVFTHEPFGYIPVESMACGTPVLTYGKQGPSESVLNGQTGWFVNNDQKLADLAIRLWKSGYPGQWREKCRKRALEFDARKIAEDWLKLIRQLADFGL